MDKNYAKEILKETEKTFNLIAKEFSLTRQEIWPEFNIFKNFIKEKERILDIGCGNGRFLETLREMKVEYIGLDISENILEIARKTYPSFKFLKGSILDLPFPDNYFDVVLAIAVLHHIPSQELREKAVSECYRVLKPNGTFIVSVWDLWGKKKNIVSLLKYSFLKIIGRSKLDFGDIFLPWGKKAKRYYHFFRKSEIIRLIEKQGFKIIEKGVSKNKKGRRANIFLIAQKPPS